MSQDPARFVHDITYGIEDDERTDRDRPHPCARRADAALRGGAGPSPLTERRAGPRPDAALLGVCRRRGLARSPAHRRVGPSPGVADSEIEDHRGRHDRYDAGTHLETHLTRLEKSH